MFHVTLYNWEEESYVCCDLEEFKEINDNARREDTNEEIPVATLERKEKELILNKKFAPRSSNLYLKLEMYCIMLLW